MTPTPASKSAWRTVTLRYLTEMRSGDGITSEDIEEAGSFPVYGGNGLRGYTERFTHTGEYLLIGRQGAHCGNVHWVSGRFWASEHAVVTKVLGESDPKWFAYLLGSLNLNQYSIAAAQPGLAVDRIRGLTVGVPPADVQRSIASFLDRKTAVIDALIAKKERLIELLQEKRQALITQAVTKGLDPNVPMKESGVPSIGRMPAHWVVKRLKHISPSQTVGVVVNPSSYYADEGIPFLFGGNVREGRFLLDNVRHISVESNRLLRKSMLKAGDLVTVRVGYPGVTAVIPPDLDGCNCASMMIIRRSKRFDSTWLCMAMNSLVGRQQVEIVQYGAAQEQFNISHAVDFAFPLPPLDEQERIARIIGARTRRLDEVVNAIQTHNEKLREYRQALITAAVTGKIDVSEAA